MLLRVNKRFLEGRRKSKGDEGDVHMERRTRRFFKMSDALWNWGGFILLS